MGSGRFAAGEEGFKVEEDEEALVGLQDALEEAGFGFGDIGAGGLDAAGVRLHHIPDGVHQEAHLVRAGLQVAGLFGVAWASWSWLPIAPEAAGLARLAMAALFAIVVISFSPTMRSLQRK